MAVDMKGVFITGTDTDVGKTFISSAILRALVNGGLSVAGLKPIASGFEVVDGQWTNSDVSALTAASNVELPEQRVNRYGFKPAIAPHIAAQQDGVLLDFGLIKQDFEYAANRSSFVLVEGVGGWYVPLSDPSSKPTHNIQSLAQHLQLPVIMVVGMKLGCLNHAVLTENAINQSGLRLLGWVANHVDPDFDFANENVATLEQQLSSPKLFDFPYVSDDVQASLDTVSQSDYIKKLL